MSFGEANSPRMATKKTLAIGIIWTNFDLISGFRAKTHDLEHFLRQIT